MNEYRPNVNGVNDKRIYALFFDAHKKAIGFTQKVINRLTPSLVSSTHNKRNENGIHIF